MALRPNSIAGTLAAFWGPLWVSVFFVIGIVTGIFGVLEYFGGRLARVDQWDPRSLPPVKDLTWVPRFTSVFDWVFNLLFVLFIFDVVPVRQLVGYMVLGPLLPYVTATPLAFALWWHLLVAALVLVALANIAVDAINLARPRWARRGVAHPERYQDVATALNGALFAAFVIWAIIASVIIAVNAIRLRKQPGHLVAASENG